MMRVLAVLLVLLGVPLLAAAASTQWPSQDDQASYSTSSELAQATQPARRTGPGGQSQGPGDQSFGVKPTPSLSGGDYPGRYCCLHCRANEIPCGGECIPVKLNGKPAICKQVAGCACPGKP
jgi:hypothetical protein